LSYIELAHVFSFAWLNTCLLVVLAYADEVVLKPLIA